MLTIMPQMNTLRPQTAPNKISFGSISKTEHEAIDKLADTFKKTGAFPDTDKAFKDANSEHKSELLEALQNAINKAFGKDPEPESQGIKHLKELNQRRKSV